MVPAAATMRFHDALEHRMLNHQVPGTFQQCVSSLEKQTFLRIKETRQTMKCITGCTTMLERKGIKSKRARVNQVLSCISRSRKPGKHYGVWSKIKISTNIMLVHKIVWEMAYLTRAMGHAESRWRGSFHVINSTTAESKNKYK